MFTKLLIQKLYNYINFHKDFTMGISSKSGDSFVIHDKALNKYFCVEVHEVEEPNMSDEIYKDYEKEVRNIFTLLDKVETKFWRT